MTAPAGARPAWLDAGLYPFASHFAGTSVGRLHYLDEGAGRPVVMVHGAPTWSFLYRHLIRSLSGSYRCIAPDLMGFGLSDKPENWSYLPQHQAAQLSHLLEGLGVEDATLVVHDWGGPIGLAWMLERPERVRDLVIFNTWMWSVRGSLRGELGGRLFASLPWRMLERRLGLSTRFFMPGVMGDRRKLTPEIHRHYREPFATPAQRRPNEVLWREILGASDWLAALWERGHRLREKRALLLWGLRDPAFPPRDLERWQRLLPDARTRTFPNAGHFLQEEEPEAIGRCVGEFLAAGLSR